MRKPIKLSMSPDRCIDLALRVDLPDGERLVVFPKWDGLGFFEAIKLLELEGRSLVLSADVQRHFFRGVPFGKKRVKAGEDGRVWVSRRVAFGQDSASRVVRYDQASQRFIGEWGCEVLDHRGRVIV